MAVDSKYGRVTTERGSIGEDEPVVVFRAQDRLLPSTLRAYRTFCVNGGSPQVHLDLVAATITDVEEWQKANFTKIPESAGYSPE